MKLLKVLNDFKIDRKLGIIYIVCVLIPVMVTNGAVINAIKKDAIKQQEATINHLMERMAYNMTSQIESCCATGSHLCIDKTLNDFLDKNFASNVEYYMSYRSLMQNNILKYYYNAQRVSGITLYADNPTMVNGGSFWRLDKAKDEQWYRMYKQSNSDMVVIAYYENIRRYLSVQAVPRMISFITKMDYFGNSKVEKLAKIDLNYNAIQRDILNEKFDGEIYICNERYILFNNKINQNLKMDFSPLCSLDLTRKHYRYDMNIGNSVWQIYVVPKEIQFGHMIKDSKQMIILLLMINLLLPSIIIYIIGKSFSARLKLIELYFNKVKHEEFECIEGNMGKDEIGSLIKSYNLMVEKIKELIEVVFKKNAEKQASELARKNAELKALQSQINPHFMFNTLESIRMRSLIKGEQETAEIIGQLALILRQCLAWNKDMISIKEEIDFVKKYAAIQKYRFGEKLIFSFYIMDGCEGIQIPKLSILTFVENACIHGIERVAKEGSISVVISKDETDLFIEISDSGVGIEEGKVQYLRKLLEHPDIASLSATKSTGMLNALLRMNFCCEGAMSFELDSKLNQGTDITIKVALEKLMDRGKIDDKSIDCG